jgi:hypothetical protein
MKNLIFMEFSYLHLKILIKLFFLTFVEFQFIKYGFFEKKKKLISTIIN